MRKRIIAGNWKMHKNASDVLNFCKELKDSVADVTDLEILVFPPFPYLLITAEVFKDTNLKFGAQNVFQKDSGAFTGEVSYSMLLDIGCNYVLVGHSERRKYFNETDESVNSKVSACLENGLKVILCVGETLEQREKGTTFDVIRNQLAIGLQDINELTELTIAYEPVWAIGTGKTATGEQAEEVHKLIREQIKKNFSDTVSHNISILYGGSIKPENIGELIRQENIDGGLIGGASLDIEKFLKIIRTCRL